MGAKEIQDKKQTDVHVSKFAGGGGGLFKTAMNDQRFLKKVSKELLIKHQKTKSNDLSKLIK